MRLSKGNPTGTYSYLADGVAPASPVLTDGHTTFTPGISEYNALGSRFYLGDAQGNSRGLLDGGQNAQDGYNWDAFGNSVSRFGNNPTAYAWNEEAGYQSDNDSGLKLLGHRYYDSRTGRFVSQDPAGDGDNWYAYADNDPMDEADPSGLSSFFDPSKAGMGPGAGPSAWGDYNSGAPGTYDFFSGNTYTHSETISEALNAAFTSTSGPMMGMGGSPNGFFMPHNNNARASTKGTHEDGMARWAADSKKKEKGDKIRAEKERLRQERKTGKSTRDPDGSIKRMREAQERNEGEGVTFPPFYVPRAE